MSMHSSRRPRSQSGFTLIELLIVLSLSAIVLFPIFALMNQTYLRVKPEQEQNQASAQLRLFRTNLLNDWTRARVIRINATPASPANALPTPTDALSEARMDCRGGTYPWYGGSSNPNALIKEIRPAIAIHTHASGNNTGRRIVYSIVLKKNGRIDIVRRECGHLGKTNLAIGEYDPWSDDCPGAANPNNPICDMSATTATEKVIIRDATAMKLPTACNNSNAAPPFTACDANVTLVASDGKTTVQPDVVDQARQSTTIRLYQPVVSSGRMIRGLWPLYVVYDTVGRPS
jgi:prepilin-type N-terminal cleavage/methylation domain-containing protein